MAELRLRLTVPMIRLGPLTVDPIQAVLGRSVAEVFGALLLASRPTASGQELDVRLPDTVGASVPLGIAGEAGFRNERGALVLAVPRVLVGQVERALESYVVGRQSGPGATEELRVLLPVGRPVDVPLASLATIRVCRLADR
ncbi:MAG: hypothetical protein KC656_13545 [Myxococcales bacterium]|nr:hypothetical protein [Myxococcales bacterium]